jgi:trigger factor
MADQETADGGVATEEEAYTYNVTIEDLGPATKKVSVEIPEDRIKNKLAEQFKELRSQAAIPGFRVGHAPQKLIEKRFATDVKDQVRRSLVSESYEQALEKNNLNVLGEPDFENADAIQLPETGALSFSFTVDPTSRA